jgi:carbon-monoxide dehydrogenase medium subunit
MKLPAFSYEAPGSVREAVDALDQHGSDAAVLAGGQSLLLEMRYGERSPAVLVDVNAVAALDGLERQDGTLRVGALVRHVDLEGRGSVAARAVLENAGALGRLLRTVAGEVAHLPIRTRGTFVGSIAWAHPSAEWCALAALLDARVGVASRSGDRAVAASDWFVGRLRTDRRADELVTHVDLPVLPSGCGVGFVEHRRSHASFALVAALASVEQGDDGTVTSARVAVAGAADVPMRMTAAEAVLVGAVADDRACQAAGAAAASSSRPWSEPHCGADYRRHAVAVTVRRAVGRAVHDAGRDAS